MSTSGGSLRLRRATPPTAGPLVDFEIGTTHGLGQKREFMAGPGCPRTPGRRPGQVTNEQVAHAAGNEWLSEDRIASTGLAERRGGGNGCCSDSAEADPRRCHAPSWPLSSCSSSGIPGTAQSISAFGLVLRRRGASRASSSGRRFWSTARPGRHPLGDGGPSSCTWWTRSGTNEILFFTSRAVDRQLERRCPDLQEDH